MANNPVLKVVKSGKDVNSTDLRDYYFHSKYAMFKIHDIYTGSISIASGAITGGISINHNLEYVPAYLVYLKIGDNWELFPNLSRSYITDSLVRVDYTLEDPYNQTINTYYSSDVYNQNGWLADDNETVLQWYYAGKSGGGNGNGSAIRWADIVVNQGQTITSAYLELKNVFTTAGCDIKFKIWGMDEDNVDFSNPMGKTKTTEERVKQQSANTNKFNFGDDITNLLQEVVNRGGWSSGNHFGIIINDNGTADNAHWLQQDAGDRISDNMELKVTLTGTGYLNIPVRVVVFKDKIHS